VTPSVARSEVFITVRLLYHNSIRSVDGKSFGLSVSPFNDWFLMYR